MIRFLCASAVAAACIAAGSAPAWAQSACPAGYRFQAPANCVSMRTPNCPAQYQWDSALKRCRYTGPTPRLPSAGGIQRDMWGTCPAGYTYYRDRGYCLRTVAASCPAGKRIEPRTGRCVTGIPR